MTWFYDVEIFKNFFCVTFKCLDTKEVLIFEISERRNDLLLLKDQIGSFYGKYMVSFNGVDYDNYIINYITSEVFDENDSYLEICGSVKRFNDIVINDSFDIRIKMFRWSKWIDIDLFKYWSRGLRMSKMLSLKSLAVQLKYPVIQELPIHHNTTVKLSDIPNIIEYNSVHDIGVTEKLYEALQEEISLRKSIYTKYFNCMSWDSPKIASEVLLSSYCEITEQNQKEVRSWRFEKKTFRVGDYLPKFEFKTQIFKDLYERICNNYNTIDEKIVLWFDKQPLVLQYGVGGLHSENKHQQFNSSADYQIITSDVN